MEMCPVCNEPAESTEVRTDWTREAMRKIAACRGEIGGRDTGNVGAVEICHGQPAVPNTGADTPKEQNIEGTVGTAPEALAEREDLESPYVD